MILVVREDNNDSTNGGVLLELFNHDPTTSSLLSYLHRVQEIFKEMFLT